MLVTLHVVIYHLVMNDVSVRVTHYLVIAKMVDMVR